MKNKKTHYRSSARQYHSPKEISTIKKNMLIKILICAFVLFIFAGFRDSIIAQGSFWENATAYILNESTDFKKSAESIKGFFSERVRLTSLIKNDSDFDPVKNMCPPANGTVVKGFGLNDENEAESFCYGVELDTLENEKIVSVCDGEVTETGTNASFGNYVLIKHSEKIYTFYGNLGEILISSGKKAEKGQIIARSGNENTYFEIRDGDSTLDPEAFINFSQS